MSSAQAALTAAIEKVVSEALEIPAGSMACDATVDQWYVETFKPVMEALEAAGWWLYPAASAWQRRGCGRCAVSEFKAGDKVWVQGTINGTLPADGDLDEAVFVQFEIPSVMVGGIVAVAGSEIVPAASVVSEADRAAVGRIVRLYALKDEQVQRGLIHSPEGEELSRLIREARDAIQPNDIEAAQRVADGGK